MLAAAAATGFVMAPRAALFRALRITAVQLKDAPKFDVTYCAN